jgi:hypothetical protein
MSTVHMTKVIRLSQIKEDLNNGLSKWKKDEIGFGSIEKKYGLTNAEMIDLMAHPKVKKMETRIPTFVIEDDLIDEQEQSCNLLQGEPQVQEFVRETPVATVEVVEIPKVDTKVQRTATVHVPFI